MLARMRNERQRMRDISASPFAQKLGALHLPRYDELPPIDLYMDQIVSYLEDTLGPLYQPGEKIITRSMVNNYVKQGIIASASGKKYTRSHIAYLIVICTLKQTFTISEIDRLIRAQAASFEMHLAYDYYCDTFETTLHELFSSSPVNSRGLVGGEEPGDFERDLVRACTAAVSYTLRTKTGIALIEGE